MSEVTWKHVRVGSLGRVVTGKTPPSANPEMMGDEYPFITPSDLTYGTKKVITERYLSRLGALKMKGQMLPSGAICYTCIGATIGKMCVTRSTSITNQQINSIIVDANSYDPDFVYYALVAKTPEIIPLAGGAATPIINKSAFSEVELVCPPLPTQHKIAAILSAYDDLIENNTRRLQVLEEMARALYREWFVEFRFPGYETAEFVEDEQGRRPEGWSLQPLGTTATNFDRFRKPLSKMQREKFRGPYPYYGAAKVFDFVGEYIFDGKYLLLAEDGSVETTEGHPVLQLVNGKFWPNNHTHVLQGNSPTSTEYLYLSLSEVTIRPYVTGAAQPKITQANMNSIPVIVGTEDVHKAFDNVAIPIFQQINTLQQHNSNLRRTRDLLLPRLISGEFDVSSLDIRSSGGGAAVATELEAVLA